MREAIREQNGAVLNMNSLDTHSKIAYNFTNHLCT